MDITSIPFDPSKLSAEANTRVRIYLNKVYSWMAMALLLTAIVAGYAMQSVAAIAWVASTMGMVITIGGSFAIFLVMIFMQNRLTVPALGFLFMAYSALTGLLFGPMLSLYTTQSLGLAFGCTAGTFGAMSLYGMFTKRNLTGLARFLSMALIGLIVCSIINIFWGNGMFDFLICIAGVVIFSGLTAYHTQRIIEEGRVLQPGIMARPAILGALSLYLAFINLFIFFLRLLGGNRE